MKMKETVLRQDQITPKSCKLEEIKMNRLDWIESLQSDSKT